MKAQEKADIFKKNGTVIYLPHEQAIDCYIQALDQGDMEGVAAVLEAACDDPELERIITEINLAYQEEEPITPIVTDAQLIRDLLRKHLHSALENETNC